MDRQKQVAYRFIALRAILYMILAALCFSLVELTGVYFIRNVSPFQIVWTRYAVHLLIMLVLLGPRYKITLVRTSRLRIQIIRSLTMLAMPLCFILAATSMPIHDVWSLQWASPLMMLGLSSLVLREPTSFRQLVATGFGYTGMLLTLRADAGIFSPFALFALGAGACLSLHLMFSRILQTDHPVSSLFHTALWVFIVMGSVMPFLWVPPSLASLTGMVIVGIVGALGLFALARAGELAPLPVVAVFAYTEAFWSLLLNALLFGMLPGKRAAVGVALILGIAILQLVSEYRRYPTHLPMQLDQPKS